MRIHVTVCGKELQRVWQWVWHVLHEQRPTAACLSAQLQPRNTCRGAGLLSRGTCANEWRLYARSKARLWPTMGLPQSRIASITAAKPARRCGGLGLVRQVEQLVWVGTGGQAQRQGCGRRLPWCPQGRAEGAEFGYMAALMAAPFLPSSQYTPKSDAACIAGAPAASWMASMRLRR